MLTVEQIRVKAADFECCMADAMYCRMWALRHGDGKEAQELLNKALVLHQAARVLSRYPDDTGNCGGEVASTLEQVECAISRAACYCKGCECFSDPVTEPSCDPVVAYTVDHHGTTADRGDAEALPPDTGDAWLVTTGVDNGAWTAPTIQTWDGAAWTSQALQEGQVIDVAGVLWIVHGGSAVPLYPSWVFTMTQPGGGYQAQPADPQTASLGRDVQIRTLYNGIWTTVLYTTEDALPGLVVYFGALPIEELRVYYVETPCEHGTGPQVMIPLPGTCGSLEASAMAVPDCGDGTFHLAVDISGLDGYLLGPTVLVVDGVTEEHDLVPGTHTLGPWDIGTTVTATVTNQNNPGCNIQLGTFTPDTCFCAVPIVVPVDAAFQPSALPGITYFIKSDTTGWGGSWAVQVGCMVTSGVFSPVAAYGDEFMLSADPQDRVVWTTAGLVPFNPGVNVLMGDGVIPLFIVSKNPAASTLYNRHAELEMTFDVVGTATVWSGDEQDLATGVNVANPAPMLTATGANVGYDFGGCHVDGEPSSIIYGIVLDMEAGVTLNVTSSTGHFALFNIDTGVVTVNNVTPAAGNYCLYPSNGSVVSNGNLTTLRTTGDVSYINPGMVGSLIAFQVFANATMETPPVIANNALLNRLEFQNCPSLTSLPETRDNTALGLIDHRTLPLVEEIPDWSMNTALTYVRLEGFNSVTTLPSFSTLSAVTYMKLHGFPLVPSIPPFTGLTALVTLDIGLFPLITDIPDISALTALTTMYIRSCNALTTITAPSNTNLKSLYFEDNTGIASLPTLNGLTALTYLRVNNSDLLTTLPSLGGLATLQTLVVQYSAGITTLPTLSGNTALTTLTLSNNGSLTALPSMATTSLVAISITQCPLLSAVGTLPKIQGLTITGATGITTSAVVDALVNALDSTKPNGTCAIGATLLALRTATSDTNYNACISNGWTFS